MTTDTATSLPTRVSATRFADRNALVDSGGRLTYSELLAAAISWGDRLAPAQAGDRVAYLVPPGRTHVAVLLGIWARGCTAVPLAVSHPPRELEYVLDDAQPRVVVIDPSLPRSPRLTASARARAAAILTPPPHAAAIPTPHPPFPHRPPPPAATTRAPTPLPPTPPTRP